MHDLEIRNGHASMAFNAQNGAPWHKLGTPVDGTMTAAEALEKGGLNYDVEAWPLYAFPGKLGFDGTADPTITADDSGNAKLIQNKRAIIRSDTGECFGVVSDGYTAIQNRQCFDFLDSLVAGHEMEYETVGAFGMGERVWMLGKLPKDLRILNSDDLVRQYILLYNSHDGSMAFRVFFTPVRVVCANTLSEAIQGSRGSGVSIRHTGNVADKVDEARKTLGLAVSFYDEFHLKADELARTPLSAAAVQAYFNEVFPSTGKDAPKSKKDVNATVRHTLTGLFENGIGQDMPTARGTAWGALNAVTEFCDHHQGNLTGERRLESNWTGDSAKTKGRALQLILAATGVADKLKPAAIETAAKKLPAMPGELAARLADDANPEIN